MDIVPRQCRIQGLNDLSKSEPTSIRFLQKENVRTSSKKNLSSGGLRYDTGDKNFGSLS